MPPNNPSGRTPRILIADDQVDLLSLLKYTLENEGFSVETASNGEEALACITSNPPDIAILDFMMPRLSGFEVTTKLRNDPLFEHLPIIILSAAATRDHKVEGLNLGADDFIAKPVDIQELMARIRMIMRRSRQGLDANPLTHLPGNISIENRIEDALSQGKPLAVLYVDLNQFKAYNDAYGFDAGDHVITSTAQMLLRVTRADPSSTDFIGHIGGDDFIVITEPSRMEELAKKIVSEFDAMAPGFYNAKDRKRKKIISKDRRGKTQSFPLISVGIGITHNHIRKLNSYAQVSQYGTELKKHAKQNQGSSYVLDRRKS